MAKKSEKTTAGQGGEKQPGRLKQIGMVAKVVHKQSPRTIPIAIAVRVPYGWPKTWGASQ